MDKIEEVIIHIGLHKTASTFLQNEFFPLHSQASGYINLRKRMRKFLDYVLCCNDLVFSYRTALRIFFNGLNEATIENRKLLISDEQFCGSPWDNAVSRKRYFDRLNAIFPQAKYIIILRNQEDMIRSLYLQYIKTGGSATWREFLNHKRHPLSIGLKDYLNYGVYIQYMVNVVGVERIGCFFYEDLQKNALDFLHNIASFSGFETSDKTFDIIHLKKNPSISSSWVILLIFANKFFRSYRQPFLLFPQNTHKLMVKLLTYLPLNKNGAMIPQSQIEAFCKEPKQFNSIIKDIYSRNIFEIGY